MSIWTKGEGAYIKITFTESLTYAVDGNQSHFTITWQEYNMVPGGSLINKTGTVLQTFLGEYDDELILEMQPLQRFHNAVGQITVAYDGAGTLQGDGGAVEAFSASFTPQDLEPKNNPHHSEHLEIVSVSATGSLPLVTYYNTRSSHEHLEIVSVTASGTLTHIDDL